MGDHSSSFGEYIWTFCGTLLDRINFAAVSSVSTASLTWLTSSTAEPCTQTVNQK